MSLALEHTLSANGQQMASFLEDFMSRKEGKGNRLQQHNHSWWKIITQGLMVKEGTIAATQGDSSPIVRAKALVDSMPAEGGDPEAIKKVQDALQDIIKMSTLAEATIISTISARMSFLATVHKNSENSGDAWYLMKNIDTHFAVHKGRFEVTETASMHKFKGKNPSDSDMYLTTCNSRLNGVGADSMKDADLKMCLVQSLSEHQEFLGALRIARSVDNSYSECLEYLRYEWKETYKADGSSVFAAPTPSPAPPAPEAQVFQAWSQPWKPDDYDAQAYSYHQSGKGKGGKGGKAKGKGGKGKGGKGKPKRWCDPCWRMHPGDCWICPDCGENGHKAGYYQCKASSSSSSSSGGGGRKRPLENVECQMCGALDHSAPTCPKVVALQQPQVNVAKAAKSTPPKSTPEELELLAEGLYNKFKSLPEDELGVVANDLYNRFHSSSGTIDLKNVESLRATVLREIENLRVYEGMKPKQLEVGKVLEKQVELDLEL
jgi:hypothetical protein